MVSWIERHEREKEAARTARSVRKVHEHGPQPLTRYRDMDLSPGGHV